MLKKKNKEILRKIYMEEYLKAEEIEKKAQLNREIQRVRQKAKEDAKRKYNRAKTLTKGTKKGAKKKQFQHRSKKIGKAGEQLRKNLLGY